MGTMVFMDSFKYTSVRIHIKLQLLFVLFLLLLKVCETYKFCNIYRRI
jgi:hypothetical protein